MGNAIGQMLPFAVGVAVSPMPIVAVVLMLVTRRARSTSLSFVAGWIVGLSVIGAIVLAIGGSGGASQSGTPATWVSALKLVSCSSGSPPAGGRPGPTRATSPRRRSGWGLVLIATISVAAPVVIYFALGTRAQGILDNLKNWMATNNAAIMAVLCPIFGAKLIGDAISGLSG